MKEYIEISKEEAIQLYCKCEDVFICNDKRKFWKMPKSYEYSSHEPEKNLFFRSIPSGEGDTKFYKSKK